MQRTSDFLAVEVIAWPPQARRRLRLRRTEWRASRSCRSRSARSRAAYAGGLDPARVMREVGRRLDGGRRSGDLHRPRSAPRRSRRWRRRSGPTTRRGRSGACPSRSRTISTSPGCRRRRAARPSPTCRRRTPSWWRGCARPGRSRSARPTSTSSRPGSSGVRTPYPVPRNALDPAHRAGRLVVGLGGGGGARRGRLQPRHRHRGVGPGAGGAQQHRRAEADARGALGPGGGAGLPDARHGVGLRADRRRRLDGVPAPPPGSTRTTPIPGRCRSGALGAAPPHPTIGVPSRESRRFFGDGAQAAAFEATVRGARRRAAPGSRRSTSRRSTRWRRCSTPAPGWRSGTRWSGRCSRATPTRCIR